MTIERLYQIKNCTLYLYLFGTEFFFSLNFLLNFIASFLLLLFTLFLFRSLFFISQDITECHYQGHIYIWSRQTILDSSSLSIYFLLSLSLFFSPPNLNCTAAMDSLSLFLILTICRFFNDVGEVELLRDFVQEGKDETGILYYITPERINFILLLG